jgi:hypothetical protein
VDLISREINMLPDAFTPDEALLLISKMDTKQRQLYLISPSAKITDEAMVTTLLGKLCGERFITLKILINKDKSLRDATFREMALEVKNNLRISMTTTRTIYSTTTIQASSSPVPSADTTSSASADQTNATMIQPLRQRSIQCRNCGIFGHIIRNCTQPKCINCGSQWKSVNNPLYHHPFNCPHYVQQNKLHIPTILQRHSRRDSLAPMPYFAPATSRGHYNTQSSHFFPGQQQPIKPPADLPKKHFRADAGVLKTVNAVEDAKHNDVWVDSIQDAEANHIAPDDNFNDFYEDVF